MRWKPAQYAIAIGALASAAASGRFSARLVLDGAIAFAFVPAFDAAALAIVARLRRGPGAAAPLALDAFADGYQPWLFWILAAAVLALAVPPRDIGVWILPLAFAGVVPAALAARLDLRHLRRVMGRRPREARIDLLLHRAISWSACLVYFFGIAIWYDALPAMIASFGW